LVGKLLCTRICHTLGCNCHGPVNKYIPGVVNSCAGGGHLSVPALKTLVMVLDAESPTVSLTGIRSQAVDEYDLSHGVHLFPDLVIDATTRTEHNEKNADDDDDPAV